MTCAPTASAGWAVTASRTPRRRSAVASPSWPPETRGGAQHQAPHCDGGVVAATPRASSRTVAAHGEVTGVRSLQLQAILEELAEQAALRLQAHVEAGEEVPFELDSRSARRGSAPLYCYRPLTDTF